MKRQSVKSLLLLFPCLFCVVSIFAQQTNEPQVTLENPYNTVYIHLHYLQPDSYQPEIAAQALFPAVQGDKKTEYAIMLKQIYDGRGLYVRVNTIPQKADYIDTTSQNPYYTLFPEELPEVYLEKTDSIWVYSRETVENIPRLHKKTYPFGTDRLLNLLPQMGQSRVLGLAIWQYLAILILLVLTFLIHKLLSGLLLPIVRSVVKRWVKTEVIDRQKILNIARAFSLLALIWMLRLLVPVLLLPIKASEFSIMTLNILTTVFVVVLLFRILSLATDYLSSITLKTESKMDEQLLPIVTRILQIIFIIGGMIQILRILDVNVTALIAGVSIGGLALALAAQDTVKNLIGSAMIFFDRPFQIGDYVIGSGFEGTIVEVGFRTTRVQKIDTSIISVPNGTIANMIVSNLGVRHFRLLNITLGLTYDTPPTLIEKFMEGLKGIIENHPLTVKEGYYVRFKALDTSSLNIMFRVHLQVPDYATELEVKERIQIAILRLAEAIGVRFAFPSTAVYMEDFPEKKSNVPAYATDLVAIDQKMEEFIMEFKKQNFSSDPT